MKNRIDKVFADLRRQGRVAFVPYVTCGDPEPDATLPVLLELARAGANVIELGIPFSDPMADGPVLQRAAERALRAGTTIHSVLQTVAAFRKESDVPVVLFGYANPLFRYGWERMARDAAAAGADGFLCVDLPPEEAGDLDRATRKAGLSLIYLLAPTSTEARMKTVLRRARGFVYFVSVAGVTGARAALPENLESLVARIRKLTSVPVGVGFGISTPGHAAEVASFADAVIVGSAFAKEIESASGTDDAVARVGSLARSLGEAVAGRKSSLAV